MLWIHPVRKLRTGGGTYLEIEAYTHSHSLMRIPLSATFWIMNTATGLLVLDKIKQTLADPYEHPPGNHKKKIWRLTKQLQTRKRLLRLRNQTGIHCQGNHFILVGNYE